MELEAKRVVSFLNRMNGSSSSGLVESAASVMWSAEGCHLSIPGSRCGSGGGRLGTGRIVQEVSDSTGPAANAGGRQVLSSAARCLARVGRQAGGKVHELPHSSTKNAISLHALGEVQDESQADSSVRAGQRGVVWSTLAVPALCGQGALRLRLTSSFLLAVRRQPSVAGNLRTGSRRGPPYGQAACQGAGLGCSRAFWPRSWCLYWKPIDSADSAHRCSGRYRFR